jgi:hypothetical protein
MISFTVINLYYKNCGFVYYETVTVNYKLYVWDIINK